MSDKELERGNHSGSQAEGNEGAKRSDSANVFQAGGLQHYSYSTKTPLTIALFVGLLSIITGAVTSYRSAVSEIDVRIERHPSYIGLKKDMEQLQRDNEIQRKKIEDMEKILWGRLK